MLPRTKRFQLHHDLMEKKRPIATPELDSQDSMILVRFRNGVPHFPSSGESDEIAGFITVHGGPKAHEELIPPNLLPSCPVFVNE